MDLGSKNHSLGFRLQLVSLVFGVHKLYGCKVLGVQGFKVLVGSNFYQGSMFCISLVVYFGLGTLDFACRV